MVKKWLNQLCLSRTHALGFDVKALVPQGLTGSTNYFGLMNDFMTLIICESLREIGEMACVTHVWSSRGQTLKLPLQKIDQVIRKNNGETSLTRKDFVFFFVIFVYFSRRRCLHWPDWRISTPKTIMQSDLTKVKYNKISLFKVECRLTFKTDFNFFELWEFHFWLHASTCDGSTCHATQLNSHHGCFFSWRKLV